MASTTVQTQSTRGRNDTKRGAGRRVNNRGGRGGGRGADQVNPEPAVTAAPANDADLATSVPTSDEAASDAEDVCWICAEKIKYFSISECNHTTCHVCALRLRALYKRQECTFCKHPQTSLVITSTPPQPYQSYDLSSMEHFDLKLSMYFETGEMLENCLLLLRFNCPDSDCEFIASGWADLKWHVRDRHGRLLCDLCIHHKKIFAHEHTTYTPNQYPIHMPSLRRNPHHKEKEKEVDMDTHPMCSFCQECFYGDDELYSHLRERHEECFVCKKEGIMHQYFLNWGKLELHFKEKHYPCTHPQCLEQKFVVFPTEMDLKAHSVEAHGDAMTGRDRRDAQRLEMAFATPSYAESRRGGDGNAQTIRARAGGTQLTAPEPAQPPGDGRAAGGGSRRAAFGATLTSATMGQPSSTIAAPGYGSRDEIDPEHAAQHAIFVEHVQSVVASVNGQTAIRHAVKSWRSSESTVYDMLDTIFTVLGRNMDKTIGIINRLLDVFEGEKKDELSEAWDGMKTEQRRQFPTLNNGGRSQNQPVVDYASVSAGRVLSVKHSIKSGAQKKGSTRTVWDRVERAAASTPAGAGPSSGPVRIGASGRPVPGSGVTTPPSGASSSSSAFPVLSSGGPTVTQRIVQNSTPWSAAGAGVLPHAPTPTPTPPPQVRPYSVPAMQKRDTGKKGGAPVISKAGFPALPTAEPLVIPREFISGNQSLRNIGGGPSVPAVNAWGGGAPKGGPNNGSGGRQIKGIVVNDGPKAGSEKKKGKAKETLFTLGSHRG
ncbi:hypothetical protein FRB94_001301 [Tulasnella sp. JGI-2019a]|nr:hypothetical protein FRB94_001301 [Tulasnella sp. JGI-2019a]